MQEVLYEIWEFLAGMFGKFDKLIVIGYFIARPSYVESPDQPESDMRIVFWSGPITGLTDGNRVVLFPIPAMLARP